VFLNGVGLSPHLVLAPTVPHQAVMLFQLLFAAFTPALIAGAFAERMKFSSVLLFTLLWSLFVYVPIAHWVWGGGWLKKIGALDFTGGTVVHISSGFSALACAMVLGKRRDGELIIWPPTISHTCCSVRDFCGPVGSVLTEAAPKRPPESRSMPLVVTHLTAVMAALT
jgi:Amt family ammonium transporter